MNQRNERLRAHHIEPRVAGEMTRFIHNKATVLLLVNFDVTSVTSLWGKGDVVRFLAGIAYMTKSGSTDFYRFAYQLCIEILHISL